MRFSDQFVNRVPQLMSHLLTVFLFLRDRIDGGAGEFDEQFTIH